jgi:hypothetical protein
MRTRTRRSPRASHALAVSLTLLAATFSGCETTAEKSAKLEHEAKHEKLADKGLTITHESALVHVLATSIVSSSEGSAATVTLQNRSGRALHAVPLAIAVTDASGHTTFQNNAPGLEAALTSVPSLAPHATLTWVDDQLPAGGGAAGVGARVGEAAASSAPLPRMMLSPARLVEEPSGAVATGTVTNDSAIAQRPLVVFAVARRGARIVAAGRAVLPELTAHSSSRFQVAFLGEAAGARVEAAAPATTLG